MIRDYNNRDRRWIEAVNGRRYAKKLTHLVDMIQGPHLLDKGAVAMPKE
jgi:hypothetical protein